MTLKRRVMSAKFTLGTGAFGATGSDAVTVSGLRMSANIQKTGGAAMSNLELRVWGMPLEAMQQLTVLNILAFDQVRRNTVTVLAGDEGGAQTAVFSGVINEAWVDASGYPEMAFVATGQTAVVDSVKPIPPTSFAGSVDIATILAGIGAQMDIPRSVENSGVQFQFSDPYLAGTAIQQIAKVLDAARCSWAIDDDPAAVIAIWPRGQARGSQILDVSPSTGLVGYPQFTQSGIKFRLLFTPNLIFGQQVKMTSSLGAANGTWQVAAVAHTLEAEVFSGQWFTDIECGLLNHEAPIIGRVG